MERIEAPLSAPVGSAVRPSRRNRQHRARAADALIEVMPTIKRRFVAALPEELREHMVTPHQLDTLCRLSAQGSMSMHDLARCQGIGVSSATALADRLVRQGLVERAPDPDDRRVVRLAATSAAAELIDRFRRARRDGLLAALDGLDDAELDTLTGLLRRVALADHPGED